MKLVKTTEEVYSYKPMSLVLETIDDVAALRALLGQSIEFGSIAVSSNKCNELYINPAMCCDILNNLRKMMNALSLQIKKEGT